MALDATQASIEFIPAWGQARLQGMLEKIDQAYQSLLQGLNLLLGTQLSLLISLRFGLCSPLVDIAGGWYRCFVLFTISYDAAGISFHHRRTPSFDIFLCHHPRATRIVLKR